MDLKNKKVMVVGTGISGIGAVNLLNKVGADCILYDCNDKLKVEDVENKLGFNKAEIIIGECSDELIKRVDLLVISPGVPIDSELVIRFKEAGVEVWGEIELAYNYDKGQIIAITGTNGKTTTTALVGQIMKAYNEKTFVVGNIGRSYTGEVLNTSKDSVTVAEISSFQLETTKNFHPRVSAILNITPDHLNRHHTMECYAETKERVALMQNKDEVCVLNYEDEWLQDFKKNCKAKIVWFSSKRKVEVGAYVDGDMIHYTDGVNDKEFLNVHDMRLLGVHNYENVCAAIAMTKAMGVPDDVIIREIKNFRAVEHRIEYVATKSGVDYYNDSKGTNTDAAIKAIEAMVKPTILIAGGYDKGVEFDDYIKAFKGKVRFMVLLGQTSQMIADTANKYGFTDYVFANSMEEVVDICAKTAKEGEAVLLSPACASWGMFDNYEQRGRIFKDLVNKLP
ncbi:UDP-N-acetylmuramoyl-L-alanine--D-glutamate ligase [Lachnospira multipara]|uniref:UDP-N-acetylmuramoyl-L-alanine--D-glutamate ligase n=1 Tax=Lachnospira multipara TaxID=28051 RepID=UPI0004E215DA|nr:UDP-N-acetylmuramoyl-L-alanine--D-glutamate ligase [Lachnospira multipara]